MDQENADQLSPTLSSIPHKYNWCFLQTHRIPPFWWQGTDLWKSTELWKEFTRFPLWHASTELWKEFARFPLWHAVTKESAVTWKFSTSHWWPQFMLWKPSQSQLLSVKPSVSTKSWSSLDCKPFGFPCWFLSWEEVVPIAIHTFLSPPFPLPTPKYSPTLLLLRRDFIVHNWLAKVVDWCSCAELHAFHGYKHVVKT